MTVGHLILILLRSSNAPEVFSTFFFNHQPALDSPLTTALVLRNQTCFLPPAAALGWERRNAATPRPRRSWKVFIMFPMD